MDVGLSNLLGGIGTLGAGIASSISNYKSVQATNKAQMDLAKYQADRNLELWNLNNEYNTPQAQMERYKAAGLNPNLIYGEGTSSSGNSSSPANGFVAPSLHAPKVDTSFVPTAAQQIMNGLNIASAVRKADSETAMNYQSLANLQQDESIKRIKVLREEVALANDKTQREYLADRLSAEIANLDSRTHQSESSAFLVDSNRRLLEAQRPFLVEEARERVRSLMSQTNVNHLRAIGLDIDNQYKSDMFSARIANLLADAELKGTYASLNEYGSELKKILLDSGLDISGDEFDRMLYASSRGSAGGKATNSVFKTLISLLSAIIH